MKWSWRLGRVGDIEVFVHATFALIVAFVGWSHWSHGAGLSGVVEGIAFLLAIFACVVLHEFGHAMAARRFGIKTRDITLYPIGGVARLEGMPEKPLEELWVALAGPSVNVVVAVVLFVWLVLSHTLQPLGGLTVASGPFFERLLATNIFLAGFNLIPAFPMDGGRVLRAVLAMKLEYTQATQIAASIGQGVALLFGFWGLFGNPMLLFIAFFVWIGAAQEASMVQIRSALAGIPVSRAMMTNFDTLSPADPLTKAVELILRASQQDFPVMKDNAVVGILTRSDLLVALAQRPQDTPVGEVMIKDFVVVESGEMLEQLFSRLQECGCHTVPVMQNQTLIGVVTSDNIGEFLMIQAALKGQAPRPLPPIPRETTQ